MWKFGFVLYSGAGLEEKMLLGRGHGTACEPEVIGNLFPPLACCRAVSILLPRLYLFTP